MTADTLSPPRTSAGGQLLHSIRNASPALWWSIITMCIGAFICLVLQQMDTRTVNGVNTWIKPEKFFASLAIQFATVAWALQFLQPTERASRTLQGMIAAMVAAAWFELAYIGFRGARAEASHFNVATPVAALLYEMMALGAVTLTATAAYIGWRVWRSRQGLWPEAAALGLMIGMVLATLTGFAMGSRLSHAVGGAPDVPGLGFFGWSTTGGDLRVAHFVGLHAAQIIPFAALTGSRTMVWLAALLCSAVTALVFAQALLGMPLFKA